MRIPTMDTKLRRAECGWLGDHASRLEEMYSGSHFYPVMAKKLEPFFFFLLILLLCYHPKNKLGAPCKQKWTNVQAKVDKRGYSH